MMEVTFPEAADVSSLSALYTLGEISGEDFFIILKLVLTISSVLCLTLLV